MNVLRCIVPRASSCSSMAVGGAHWDMSHIVSMQGLTLANTKLRASLHSALPARAAPYPSSSVAGRTSHKGMSAAVAPEGSPVSPSMAYLNRKGTCSNTRADVRIVQSRSHRQSKGTCSKTGTESSGRPEQEPQADFNRKGLCGSSHTL